MLKQKTATDATQKEPKNWNSHNKPLNAITHFTTRTQVLIKSVIHKDDYYFGMIFTVILCHPASWCQNVNTQHYTSFLYHQCQQVSVKPVQNSRAQRSVRGLGA
jgi:hypothetical protein